MRENTAFAGAEEPMILYLRVTPGFGIAVEGRTRPELFSYPTIMGGFPTERGLVREVNLAAEYRGVRPGMTLAQAHQHCPDGIFLAPNLPRYQAVWDELCAILQGYTPSVEPIELGEAVCDLSGSERRWRDGWAAAAEIAARIRQRTGITPCLGVASNRLVAQLASARGGAEGIAVVERGHERDFLADLPLTLLPGVDAQLALTFQVLGLKTIKQFAALPLPAVKQRFGAVGERMHACARGRDPRPVIPPPTRPSIAARRECDDGSIEEAVEVLRRLTEICGIEMQERCLAGTLITLTLFWEHSGVCAVPPEPQPLPPPPTVSEEVRRILPVPVDEKQEIRFPVSYRIHSMLPQPGNSSVESKAVPATYTGSPARRSPESVAVPSTPSEPFTRGSAVVRTPISDAGALLERAQRLLLQHWPRRQGETPRLYALEIEVSEFAQPMQLSFAELNRFDQVGALGGMDAVRLQALTRQEEALEARYGDASFRHLAHVDPASILAERRFRWAAGLPWKPAPERRPARRRR
jgi:DNA polymerase-4